MRSFPLPACVEAALVRLREQGIDAYVVGGSVRDFLRGERAHDYDLAAGASPQRIREVFAGERVLETGIAHGTITVILDDQPLEITAFRADGRYTDSRHPDSVRFVQTIEEDLARRDFTVNAMAYSLEKGLVDPFGGERDLKNGVLRCVGNASTRFEEDALRILRAVRFCATLALHPEERTAKAIRELAPQLSRVSAERLFSELCLTLTGERAEEMLLKFPEVFCTLVPALFDCVGFEQHSIYHCYDVYTHTAKTVGVCDKRLSLRLAALYHDVGKPAVFYQGEDGRGHFPGHAKESARLARESLRRFRAPKALSEEVELLVRYHDYLVEAPLKEVRRFASEFGVASAHSVLLLSAADARAHARDARDTRLKEIGDLTAFLKDLERSHACLSLSSLAINGEDLKAIGFPEGKGMGETLQEALNAVVDGTLDNTREALVAFSKKRLS